MARALREALLPSARAFVWGEQIHGRGVAAVGYVGENFSEISGVDALICSTPGVCIAAFSADCPILYIADREKRVIALVHSGRRGTRDRVVTACMEEMRRSFGSSAVDCLAVVAPSIGPCCYPADLWRSLEEELTAIGVRGVCNPAICTSCHPEIFFSYRRDRGCCGRMLAAMMIDIL